MAVPKPERRTFFEAFKLFYNIVPSFIFLFLPFNRFSCSPARHVKRRWLFFGEYAHGSCLYILFLWGGGLPFYLLIFGWVSDMTHTFLHYSVILPALPERGAHNLSITSGQTDSYWQDLFSSKSICMRVVITCRPLRRKLGFRNVFYCNVFVGVL